MTLRKTSPAGENMCREERNARLHPSQPIHEQETYESREELTSEDHRRAYMIVKCALKEDRRPGRTSDNSHSIPPRTWDQWRWSYVTQLGDTHQDHTSALHGDQGRQDPGLKRRAKERDKEVVGEGKEGSWRDALTSGLVTEPVMDLAKYLHSVQSQGARFENFGEHSHSRFSHTLPVLAKERPQFFAFENKPVVSLSGDEVLVDLNATSRVQFDVSSSSMEYSDRDESLLDDGSDEVTRTSLSGDSTITSPNDPEVAEDPSIVDSDQNLHSEEALANFLVDDTFPEPLFFPRSSASPKSSIVMADFDAAERAELEADPEANEY
ncbi:hypothetical protein DFH08DRAFT_824989 [Mycena albidolilacea]|uniref:Uncharacterized protein n=1 Tax=Mycena albidolilacea TaxID=1033008 RepID=A0AAD6Z3T5_9AGAR|nr:hypothetical protein DFH08DRAFT_824989 [Mycena albidolilacea]